MKIGNKIIGRNEKTFIIAEIGMNHNGDMDLAKLIIKSAAVCGCDAVKFQMFTAEKLVIESAKTYGNEDGHLPEYQQEMYRKYELTKEQYQELGVYARSLGLSFFASVWDEENADLLNEVGGDCFKFGSMDITHLPLLKHCARKGKPMIMSTGMATFEEIDEAVAAVRSEGNEQIILLHCVSGYPTKIEDSNLLFVRSLLDRYTFPIGFSDHTPGPFSSIGAVALGAKIIEKHFTIDKKLPGVDHHLSMNPVEMKRMVDGVRLMEKAVGDGTVKLTDSEQETRKMARRSIIINTYLPVGSVISKEMLTIKRPGTGIPPKFVDAVIGKVVKQEIKADTILDGEMLQ